MKKKSEIPALPVIVLLALVLRLAGIMHGFPFIFHPDEPSVIRSALDIRFFSNPGHFDWPHLYFYVNYFLFMGFAKFRDLLVTMDLQKAISQVFPLLWQDSLIFYVLSRTLTALLGAFTVIPIYKTGKRVFDERVGLLAALVFAVLPYHVHQSHYALPDIPMTFFVALGMYFVSGVLKNGEIQDYAGSGFYAGLAATTKYNGGLTFFTMPLAHLFRVFKEKEKLFEARNIANPLFAIMLAAGAFILGTPYALMDYATFLRSDSPKGALWQFTNVGSTSLIDRPQKFVTDMLGTLADDLGYSVLVATLVVFLLLIYRSIRKIPTEADSDVWFFLVSALLLLVYVSGFAKSRSQYFLMAYPYLAIVFGYFLELTFSALKGKLSILGFALFATSITFPFYLALTTAVSFYNSDTRVQAYSWLKKNVKPTDTLMATEGIKPVIAEFTNAKYGADVALPKGVQGYLILGYKKDLGPFKFSMLRYQGRLKEVYKVDNALHLGPKIVIYAINK